MTTPDIDAVAVKLACDGDRTVTLSEDEFAAAVTLLERRNWSDSQIGSVLGVASRTVAYVRQGGQTRRLPRANPKKPAANLPDEAFLTVAEVARELRVSRMTVYRLVNAGELRSLRIGRSVRVPARALADYLRDADSAA